MKFLNLGQKIQRLWFFFMEAESVTRLTITTMIADGMEDLQQSIRSSFLRKFFFCH